MTHLELLPDPHEVRSELGGDASGLSFGASNSTVLLRVLHITDMHLMDAGSPARCDWVESLADDPKWHPLLHMARPFDTLANWGLAALMRAVRNNGGEFADIAIFTGDNIDNAQRNELDAYLALLDGGSFAFPYEGPQLREWAEDPRTAPLCTKGQWPFWLPDGGPDDVWRSNRGFPLSSGLLNDAGSTVESPGIGLPWLPVLGNHDVMRQGTVYTVAELESIAVGAERAANRPHNFDPADPFQAYLADPARFSTSDVNFAVRPNPERRSIDRDEFIRAHRESARTKSGTCLGGFTGDTSGDYVHDTEHVRIVVLDTNHPAGHYQGSIGVAQLAWLHDVLSESDAAHRPVLVASHHGGAALDNTHTTPEHDGHDRRLAADLESVLLRHDCVVGWLVGHRHIHRVRPVGAAGARGFWEITTASMIDYPCQARIVEVVQDANGDVGLRTTVVQHSDRDIEARDLHERLAALHRHTASLAAMTDGTKDSAARRTGRPTDRNALLPRR